MPRIIYGKEARLAAKIMRNLPRQIDIAKALGEKKQTIHYRVKEVYPEMLEEAIKLMDMAGYEVREKDE